MAITMPILIYYGIQGTLNDLYECYFSYNFSYGTEAQPFAWFTWRLFLKGITFGGCSLLMIFSNYTVWKHTKSVPFLIAWIAGILITWIADFMGGRAPYNYFIILLPYAFIGLVGLMELVKEKLQWKLFYSRKLYLSELFTLVLYQSSWPSLLPIYYRISTLAIMQYSDKIILHNSVIF